MLKPLPASAWNEACAAHLSNRAAFGATPAEVRSIARLGLDGAVSYFLDFERFPDFNDRPSWAKPDPERNQRIRDLEQMARQVMRSTNMSEEQKRDEAEKSRKAARELQRDQGVEIGELRGLWLRRMALGARPLQEKLVLFWHGHFATSAVKVRNSYYLWRQMDIFRRLGSGNWLELLQAVATDPAMLVWLDQAQSRREHPNENFARECMELFTLGEGHYTESDVTEAARAMTGWSLDALNEEYRFRPALHDEGYKTVLGQSGRFYGPDILEIIVAQPQAARFITGKLWKFFAADDPDPAVIAALADVFRLNGNNFKPLLRAMFRCEAFYSDAVVASQVKSPVQWLVGSIRLLQTDMPPALVSTEMIRILGQDLLAPPNVKGWDGGLSWITTNTLLARYNQAAVLVMGQGNLADRAGNRPGQKMAGQAARAANAAARAMPPVDVNRIVTPADRADAESLIASLGNRFLQGRLTEHHRQILRDYLGPRSQFDDASIRHAIRLLMCTPEYQIT
jgi:uncharacterized protein (DUF1800 family)